MDEITNKIKAHYGKEFDKIYLKSLQDVSNFNSNRPNESIPEMIYLKRYSINDFQKKDIFKEEEMILNFFIRIEKTIYPEYKTSVVKCKSIVSSYLSLSKRIMESYKQDYKELEKCAKAKETLKEMENESLLHKSKKANLEAELAPLVLDKKRLESIIKSNEEKIDSAKPNFSGIYAIIKEAFGEDYSPLKKNIIADFEIKIDELKKLKSRDCNILANQLKKFLYSNQDEKNEKCSSPDELIKEYAKPDDLIEQYKLSRGAMKRAVEMNEFLKDSIERLSIEKNAKEYCISNINHEIKKMDAIINSYEKKKNSLKKTLKNLKCKNSLENELIEQIIK